MSFEEKPGIKARVLPLLSALKGLASAAEDALVPAKSERHLEREAQSFWSESGQRKGQDAHWRGVGMFADDARWLAIGRPHLDLYEQFARAEGKSELRRVVEWGAGGGANAVHFAPRAKAYFGVDISADTLTECGKQIHAAAPHASFTPVLIDAATPEAALAQVPACDLFLSTYVFELLPSPAHGLRVLRCAKQLLEPGGLAIIQIKYRPNVRVRRRAQYSRDLANMTTYGIEEFWLETERCGLVPRAVTLVPEQPLVQDRNYAYFMLRQP